MKLRDGSMCMRIYRLFLIICFMSLSACATVDVTNDPRLSHLAGQCFEVQQDSFIYTRSCGNVDGIFHGWEECNAIQIPGKCLPDSYIQYERNPKEAEESLRSCLMGLPENRNSKIIGELLSGTKIKINKVFKYTVGMEVTCWLSRAVIETGQYEGLEVELPSCSYHQAPLWIASAAAHLSIPHAKPEYLKPCSDEIRRD